jgi:hypothetical protein
MVYEGKRRRVCVGVFLLFKIYMMSENVVIRYILFLVNTRRLSSTHPCPSCEDNLLEVLAEGEEFTYFVCVGCGGSSVGVRTRGLGAAFVGEIPATEGRSWGNGSRGALHGAGLSLRG